jgi:tetratricopeptide (TPR) repeat protein
MSGVTVEELARAPTEDAAWWISRGAELARRGDWGESRAALVAALVHTDASERDYARAVRALGQVLAANGDRRGALACAWYLRDGNEPVATLGDDGILLVDRARTESMLGDRGTDHDGADSLSRTAAVHRERAARAFAESGRPARAAFEYEAAGKVDEAAAVFARLAGDPRLHDDPYVAGLVRYNVARTERRLGTRTPSDAAEVAAGCFEAAAARFLDEGQRERAFDCYEMLVAVGTLTGAFEHRLEGFVNAIRVLTEDDLRAHAIAAYERAMFAATAAGEHAAAATLAADLGVFATRRNMTAMARRAAELRGDAFLAAARAAVSRRAATDARDAAESALVASGLAFVEAGVFSKARGVYRELAELELPSARRSHYAVASHRFDGVADVPRGPALLASNDAERAPPPLWRDDLLEWEDRGDALEACADLLAEPDDPARPAVRRLALVGQLAALAAAAAGPNDAARTLPVVAERLGAIELYRVISPLESLARHRLPAVRFAAVRALSRCPYKRTFVSLERALRDSERTVVDEARRAIERLRFDHAFDPLVRLYRAGPDGEARLAALRAITRLAHPDARELVERVLESGSDVERRAVRSVLGESGAQASTSSSASARRG